MKTTVIPTPNSNSVATLRCEAILPDAATALVVSENGPSSISGTRKLFRALRAFLSSIGDSSAFQDISVKQQVEIIFTSNGPLIYRCEPTKKVSCTRNIETLAVNQPKPN
jgi:hypothetical protein